MKDKKDLRDKILKDIQKELECKYLSKSKVCYLMQLIRILLELDQTKSKYKLTNHYCNWLLHSELNKSNSPYIIKNIADSFQNVNSKNDFIKKINEAISIRNLIAELKEIISINFNKSLFINDFNKSEYILNFISLILNQIMLRPINLNSNDIVISEFGFSIYGLQIVIIKEKYCIELLSKDFIEKEKKMYIDVVLYNE